MPPFARDPYLRLVKFLISVAFWVLRSIIDGCARVLRPNRPGRAMGIYYHQLLPEHRARFAKQMDHLLRWAVPISADHRQPLHARRHYATAYHWVPWAAELKRRILVALRLRRGPGGGATSARSGSDPDARPKIGSSCKMAHGFSC